MFFARLCYFICAVPFSLPKIWLCCQKFAICGKICWKYLSTHYTYKLEGYVLRKILFLICGFIPYALGLLYIEVTSARTMAPWLLIVISFGMLAIWAVVGFFLRIISGGRDTLFIWLHLPSITSFLLTALAYYKPQTVYPAFITNINNYLFAGFTAAAHKVLQWLSFLYIPINTISLGIASLLLMTAFFLIGARSCEKPP